ncbi:ribosome biogenesis GTPase Der [Alicyclobacillaceae bacterium I2511]|nr:ribosome biogenesis GTPase Der [Alicyclobacillaceae bacterium I2511]
MSMVAIVGRANVGKSTLFNRLTGHRIAIVEDISGITRDRISASCDWNGLEFQLVDTGGIQLAGADEMTNLIRVQAEMAIDEADVIIFLVDGRDGMTGPDREVADLLRRSGKPVTVAVNKLDYPTHQSLAYEFYELGFGEPIGVSAEHGQGTGDLLDIVVSQLPPQPSLLAGEDVIKVAVIGRPNVGKSSLVNAILGQERVMVSPVAGTTRDAVDLPFVTDGQSYLLIDTAGLRKRGKVYESIEKYSVIRALRAIERCDVAVLVLDGHEGITEQDKRVAGLAVQAGRAVMILVNKWDIVEKDDKTAPHFEQHIKDEFQFMRWAPVAFVSAKNKQRIQRILPMVRQTSENHAMRITTATLNRVLSEATGTVPPPSVRGRKLRVYYATQVSTKPPSIAVFVNDPELMHFSYQRYLENQFRLAFGFEGTPMRLFIRART